MPESVKRTVRITTAQKILADVPPVQEGFPMRRWNIEVSVLGEDGTERPATIFDKVTYKLHPTFANPTRSFKKPPFRIEEEGWGEFDLKVILQTADHGPEFTLSHDLNFLKDSYKVDHVLTFPTNKPRLVELLAESGPVPETVPAAGAAPAAAAAVAGEPATGDKRPAEGADAKPKVKRPKVAEKGSVDLEKLAQGLEKLNEEDILSIVQMVQDNKTTEMFIKNDAEAGEFHMDLYSFPDRLLKTMWELVKKRTEA